MTLHLLIPADDFVDIIYLDTSTDLAPMQQRLGGYIEVVPLPEATMWVGENAKFQAKPANRRASQLASSSLFGYDWIAGDAIITGPSDPRGDITDLPWSWVTDHIHGVAVAVAPGVTRSE